MINKLFKDRSHSKPDDLANTYINRDCYFVRLRPWDWLNEKEIYVADQVDGKPKMITFGFWPQEIYLDANGQITVKEFLKVAREQYVNSQMSIPEKIDQELIEALESLVYELKIIEFKKEKTQLAKIIQRPLSKQ